MKRVLSTLAILLTTALPATAQDPGDVGVTMGYPGSIGVVWHASERVALRPDFTFSYTSSENETPGVSAGLKNSGLALGFGVSTLIYTSKGESLRTYVSPRFAYTRLTSDSELSALASGSESTANVYDIAGSFGAQYALGSRFAVFGEAGLAYSWRESTFRTTAQLSGIEGKTTSQGFGTRTAVGVAVYFD